MPVQAGLLGNPLSRLVRKPLLTVGGSVYSARSSARKQSFLRCSRRVWQFRGGSGRALFTSDSRRGLRLSPGAKVDIGWLRYDQMPALNAQVSEKAPATQ